MNGSFIYSKHQDRVSCRVNGLKGCNSSQVMIIKDEKTNKKTILKPKHAKHFHWANKIIISLADSVGHLRLTCGVNHYCTKSHRRQAKVKISLFFFSLVLFFFLLHLVVGLTFVTLMCILLCFLLKHTHTLMLVVM